jgi:FkbM family methyltransferase
MLYNRVLLYLFVTRVNGIQENLAVPWRDKAECRPPRKTYDPKVELKDTLVNNRHDPPLEYKNCNLGDNFHWWGQTGEDRTVYNRFFRHRNTSQPRIFVEMGGLDGATFSNTLVFEQCLGWNSMLIEGNPKNYQLMVKNRPCTHNVWSIACPPRSSHAFMTPVEGTSTVQNTNNGGQNYMVPCRTLASVFFEYGIRHIDFFSLDVEGFEAEQKCSPR